MSDTPRTDALWTKTRAERGLYGMAVMADLARQLERELAEARAAALPAYETVWQSWVAQCRKLGAMIPCAAGGTFEADPPDAILDAAARTFAAMGKELAEAQKRVVEWQPIETAPTDGTPILAFWPQLIANHPSPGTISVCKKEGRHWVLECYGLHECATPTHWMPLPTPPAPSP